MPAREVGRRQNHKQYQQLLDETNPKLQETSWKANSQTSSLLKEGIEKAVTMQLMDNPKICQNSLVGHKNGQILKQKEQCLCGVSCCNSISHQFLQRADQLNRKIKFLRTGRYIFKECESQMPDKMGDCNKNILQGSQLFSNTHKWAATQSEIALFTKINQLQTQQKYHCQNKRKKQPVNIFKANRGYADKENKISIYQQQNNKKGRGNVCLIPNKIKKGCETATQQKRQSDRLPRKGKDDWFFENPNQLQIPPVSINNQPDEKWMHLNNLDIKEKCLAGDRVQFEQERLNCSSWDKLKYHGDILKREIDLQYQAIESLRSTITKSIKLTKQQTKLGVNPRISTDNQECYQSQLYFIIPLRSKA